MLEEDLYRPVHDFLQQRFQGRLRPTYGDLRPITAVTARSGGNRSGVWSKPDLCLIALWRQKYTLSWNFDVHGFEVKTQTGCDPTAVHEAHNHTALVHFAHLVWHNPDWSDGDLRCADILKRCSRYGVGLIVFSDPTNVDTFAIKSEARRHEPAGDAIDDFVETRLSKLDRDKLLSWIEDLR